MRIYVLNAKKLFNLVLMLGVVIALIACTTIFSSRVSEVFTRTSSYLPIYSVETPDKKVAITFDCAWGADDIPGILKVLKKENVKATFFLVGEWMKKFPNQTKQIAAEGHDIGNHSDTHLHMSQLSVDNMRKDTEAANGKIQSITGQKCILYRAPYGDYDERLVRAAKEYGQYAIQWDVDSLDWKNISAENIIERVVKKISNGSIVLLHNDTKYTLAALPQLIKDIKKQGYSIVPVSELIYREDYYMDYQGRQHARKNNN